MSNCCFTYVCVFYIHLKKYIMYFFHIFLAVIGTHDLSSLFMFSMTLKELPAIIYEL